MPKSLQIFALSVCGLVAACGRSGSKHSDAPTNPGTGDEDVLNLAPTDLKLSVRVEDTNPNAISADTAGKKKVHAEFKFAADADYELRLAAFSGALVNCQGDQPAPVLSWSEVGSASSALALTQDSPVAANKGKNYVLAVDIDNSSQCESMDVSFAVVGTVVPSGETQNPNPTSDGIGDVTYNFETILREFGTYDGKPDRAVLLIVAPSRGTIEITSVKGPRTSQTVYVGILDKLNARVNVFGNSATPIDNSRRQSLLETHGKATAIYIEHYEQALCDGYAKEFEAKGVLEGVPVTVKFSVEANARAADDCSLHISSGLVVN